MLKSNLIEYQDGDTILQGYYAYDDSIVGQRPAVLIAHDWSGKNTFSCNKADSLAELGYLGFSLDMYGKGKIGKTNEEKTALISPLMQDRLALQKRMLAALETVKTLDLTLQSHIAAMGFCFGGLCVLDLARSGADIKGVVSFHGLLTAPEDIETKNIKAKILALHGFDDPMVTPDKILSFGKEMTQANADWQFAIYGNTMHSFTNPQANDAAFGTVYNKQSDHRSWLAMKNFFKEIFNC